MTGASVSHDIVASGQRAAERSNQTAGTESRGATFRVWRGDAAGGSFQDYSTSVSEGMVVLDAIHQIQAEVPTTSLSGGTARRESAGRARRR